MNDNRASHFKVHTKRLDGLKLITAIKINRFNNKSLM